MKGATESFELVLADRTRIPVVRATTIGRAPGNTVRLPDPTVSRRHAQISLNGSKSGEPILQDMGSSYGTFLDGRRVDGPEALRDGASIRVGNQELTFERRRREEEAGRTIVVPPGASLALPQLATSEEAAGGARPRLRSGYALKRLAATEGRRRWVLSALTGGSLVRLSDEDARLLQLLDGRRALPELVREAEQGSGAAGAVRLAQLIADLESRGLLAGSDEGLPTAVQPSGVTQWLLRPRELQWPGAGALFERLYLGGGWALFTRPAVPLLAGLIAAGLLTFAYLVAGRYGTPFVVASKVGLGGLVFIVARLAVAAVHEAAHGLAMAAFGRRVRKAGFKLLLIFPYLYVDTSEIWFEPRRRRIVVSAAGPISDFSLGAVFSFCCLVLPAGVARDVFFQVAFAAYLGGLFNLNPLLERDGYQVLADILGEQKLRRRALDQLRRELGGEAHASDSRVLGRYSIFALGWWVVAASFAAGMSVRYLPVLETLVPVPAAWGLMAGVWLALFVPVIGIVVPPLRARFRSREA
jgi:putative peptide zinc metalloprotease protein